MKHYLHRPAVVAATELHQSPSSWIQASPICNAVSSRFVETSAYSGPVAHCNSGDPVQRCFLVHEASFPVKKVLTIF